MMVFLIESVLKVLAWNCRIQFSKGKSLEDVSRDLPNLYLSPGARAYVFMRAGVPYEEAKLMADMNIKLKAQLKDQGKLDQILKFNPRKQAGE